MNRRVEQVVVVGADAQAWMAAAAILSTVGSVGVSVRVIELPSALEPADIYPALPPLRGFNERLGLDESLLLQACNALPTAGQRYSNWSGGGAPFIHGFDVSPAPGGGDLSFTQFWVKGRQQGLRTGFENFSLGAMAARAGRVPVPMEGAELHATYGYNLHARSYSALLRQLTLRSGVEAKNATISTVETRDDRISAIVLADDERVEADLFVDASGHQGALIGHMPGADFESWREWLPCDRLLVASGKSLAPYPAFNQVSAFRQGWVALLPLRDRTAVVAAYDSREISDQQLLDKLPVLAGIPISGEAVVSELAKGMRKRSWVGNCVAVGEAACSLEPLDAIQLHLAHTCISHLMALFPVEAGAFPEAELYDRIIARVGANLRDFQTTHYKLNRRFDEPLWDRSRNTAAPQTLQRKMDVFAARGRVPLYDDESFESDAWESLFIGHGLTPQSYDPRVDALPERELIGTVQARLKKTAHLIAELPTVDEFLSGSVAQKFVKAMPDA